MTPEQQKANEIFAEMMKHQVGGTQYAKRIGAKFSGIAAVEMALELRCTYWSEKDVNDPNFESDIDYLNNTKKELEKL